jgi:23S rRNA (cytidine1920-2'-O)/16S rRNA (cytidine1409-2'-O)-methyltransferase
LRKRADSLLVERGLFESRARAQAAIESGLVSVSGNAVRKASERLSIDAAIEARPAHPYVSRGALKLAHALDHFEVPVAGRVALDVGASTGGFSELLLERGAAKVYAVDVGREQLHASLRSEERLVSLEGTDARALAGKIPEPVELIVVDVSFISLTLVLGPVLTLGAQAMDLLTLVKPQFEAGRDALGKRGIVRDVAVQEDVCSRIAAHVAGLGLAVRGIIPSPIEGGDGNREFLLAARRP